MSRTLRRRLHHGDVGGRGTEHLESSGLEGLEEPLLGSYEDDDKRSEVRLSFLVPFVFGWLVSSVGTSCMCTVMPHCI